MNTQKELLKEIDGFCKAKGLNDSSFSNLAVGDSSFLHKVRRGRVLTLPMYDKLRAFMDATE